MPEAAFYRSEFKNHSRRSPLSPEAAAAYRTGSKSVVSHSPIRNIAYRSGSALFDEQEQTGHDYTNRARRIIERSAIWAPPGAPDWATDRQRLWTEALKLETRKNARWMKENILTLDYGLNRDQRWAAVEKYARDAFVRRGIIVDASMHRYGALVEPTDEDFAEKLAEWQGRGHPFLDEATALKTDAVHVMVERAKDGTLRGYRLYQPHAHLSLLTRSIGPGGFGPKLEMMNQKRQLFLWRQAWEQHLNEALAAAGSTARADCRSYFAQGIDKKPTRPHGLAKRLKAPSEKMQKRIAENHDVSSWNYALDVARRSARLVGPIAGALATGNPIMLGVAVGNAVAQVSAGQGRDRLPPRSPGVS